MNSSNQVSHDPLLKLCNEDTQFVALIKMFEKIIPDIEPMDFFQPHSRLKIVDPSVITNLHVYSLLYFHFARFPSKNKRSGINFIGVIGKNKNRKPGIYFNRSHVLSLYRSILRSDNDITEFLLKKLYDGLDKNFRSCRTEESGKFIGDTKFNRASISSVLSTPEIKSKRLSRSSRTVSANNSLKRQLDTLPKLSCSNLGKRLKRSKVVEPCDSLSLKNCSTSKNYKFVHRATVNRQASRIKCLRRRNLICESKLASKEAEVMVLANDLKKLQEEYQNLKIEFKGFSDMHSTVCKTNSSITRKLETSSNEIHYLSHKLMFFEDLKSDLKAIKNQIDDPNFKIQSEIMKASNDFDINKEFPEILVRNSLKRINPAIHLGIMMIRQIGRVSLENTMPLFLALANSVFGQNWNLGNFTPKNRLRHTLPPTKNFAEKAAKNPISQNTLPAKSFTRSFEKNVQEPAALKSSAQAIKNCDVGSLIFDHLSIKRGKAITVGVMTGKIDLETGEKKSQHLTLGVKQVVDTTALGTFRSVIEVLRLAAASAADSGSADDVKKSFKELLSKLMFQVTDDASQMRPVCDKINELIKLLGINGEMIFIHCNAHIVPALDSGVTKVLIDVEKFLQINDQMVRSYNQSFHRVSNSTIETMVRAIFQFVGDSVKNQAWAMTNDFQTFLDIIAEDGEKNFFKNPDSSKFGLSQEMCFILFYSFDSINEFLERVYAGNNMYKSCSLYVQCPYFRECLLSITLLFYHVTSPFLVAVGAETQYGFVNLSHSELLIFFPKYVDCLQTLTEDPSPYLSPIRLSFLDEFESISKISKKKYREMFETIFDRINTTYDLNLDVVKTILKLLTEEYLIVIDRQAKEFYIGDDSVVAKELAKHPDTIDLVATTSLSAEHSVGITRQDLRRAPTALMSTLSSGQVFKSSPFGRDVLSNKMTPEILGKIMKETRQSHAQKLKKNLSANDAATLRSEKQAHFAQLEANKKKIIQKKLDLAASVKNHGGPLQSPKEVDDICLKYSKQIDVLVKIIALELSYQKTVICNNSVPDSRYREKVLNKITKKYDKLSLKDRTENLKAIVRPIDHTLRFNVIDPTIFVQKATEKHNEMKKYSHRNLDLDNTISFDDPFFNNLHNQCFVAVHCIDEAEIWYPAKIISVNQNKKCSECSPLAVFHGDYPYCFKVQFLGKVVNSPHTFRLQSPLYHVPVSQIIPCLPKVIIKTGKGRSSQVTFLINNFEEILLALNVNILYAFRKANNGTQ